MRLISSDHALEVVLALSASHGSTLSQLARATSASASATQRALEILLEDGVIERPKERRSLYRLRSSRTTEHLVGLATSEIPLAHAVALAAGGSPAIEFVARERQTLIIVLSARATALAQARAARFVEALAAQHGLAVEYLDHDDIRREVLTAPGLRARMRRSEILFGSLDRTFPDRSRHGGRPGRLLHRPHPSVRLPSRNALRVLAKRHQLERLSLFGSSVRSDFRPDSDVDVLVRFRPGVRPSLRSLIELERELEATFDCDVDLVRDENLRSEIRQRLEREAVPLR